MRPAYRCLVLVLTAFAIGACTGESELNTTETTTKAPAPPVSDTHEPVPHAPPGHPAMLSVSLESIGDLISMGETLTVHLDVANVGGRPASDVRLVPPLAQGSGSVQLIDEVAPTVTDIAPGETRRLTYLFAPMTTGAVTLELGAQGEDAETGAVITTERLKTTVIVESGASIAIEGVEVPSPVNVGETFDVTMEVVNGGQTAAEELTATLQAVGSAAVSVVEAPLPASLALAGGARSTLTWKLTAMSAGTVSFTGTVKGKEARSGRIVEAAPVSSSAVTVDEPAALVATLSIPSSLTSGQSFTATLTIQNVGMAAAVGVLPSPVAPTVVSGSAKLLGPATPHAPQDIAGGSSATFTWTFSATAAGALQLSIGAQGTDANSAAVVQAAVATSKTTTVLAPGTLVVTSFTTPATIQRGKSFEVALTVANNGGSQVTGIVAAPNPPGIVATGGAQATSSSAPAALTLAPGASGTLKWTFVEKGTAAGTLVFSTKVTGTDATSGAMLASNVAESSPVDVVAAAALVVESVKLPSIISRGQAFVAEVAVRNTGGSSADQVLPALTVASTGGTAITVTTPPAPVLLSPGAATTFLIPLVESGTGPGTMQLSATASGTDVISKSAVTSAAVSSSSCTVQTPAELQVSSFVVSASVQRGQGFAVTLTVLNSGQAAALGVLANPSPPKLTASGAAMAVTSSAPAPVTIQSGKSQTFTWLYTETGTGAGSLLFSAHVEGTDSNSKSVVKTGTLSTNLANVIAGCDTALYAGITLAQIEGDFTTQIHPLMMRSTSGCSGCHASGSGRSLIVTSDASQTFHGAHAAGLLGDGPGTVLDRLVTSDPLAVMPRGQPLWTAAEIDLVSTLSCKLKAYDLAGGSTPPDEQFPPNLLDPYSGPTLTSWDNPFINHSQLTGRVKRIFGTGWTVSGVDQLAKHIALFGGVDFVNTFVEARSATPEFLQGLDMLAPDMCAQAVADRTKGPFVAIDPTLEIIDEPGSTVRHYEAETMPTKTTGQASGVGWNIYSNGYVATPVELPAAGSYTFTIRAYGTQAGTEPAKMELRFNGTVLQGFQVPNTTYQTFTFTTTLAKGMHTAAVAFTNDFNSSTGDRNLIVDWLEVTGPAGTGTGTTRRTAAEKNVNTLYRAMLFRSATSTEQGEAYTLLSDLVGLNLTTQSAWSGLCEALVKHPDALFTRPPYFDVATTTDKQRLLLVKLAQDLVARPPTATELNDFISGAKTYENMVDHYLSSTEFRDYYFHRMRLRTESNGTVDGDEPARLWTYLMMNRLPFQELLTGEYSVTATWAKQTRAVEHGKTGLLTMKGFIQGKPGLPHYNYPARVMSDFMGIVFDIPPEVFDQRATSTASSTVDPTSTCYTCHQNLTPLAHQRLRWDDNGNYRATDANGAPIDDSDRGLVASYAYKGKGLEAFSTVAVRKEPFIRRMFNAHAQLTLGRALRHADDERTLYKQLWDESVNTQGDLKAVMRILVTSPNYRRP